MGRPKKGMKKAGPLPPKTIGVRATGEWAAWVERLAKRHRIDVAKLIDLALVEFAEKRKHDEPPPERVP